MMILAALAPPSVAVLPFPSVAEQALGVRASVDHTATPGRSPVGAFVVEVGDVELFGIAGLRLAGVRGAVVLGGTLAAGEWVQVASPLGSETRLAFEWGYAGGGGWQAAVSGGVERVALGGAVPLHAPVWGAFSRVDLGPASVVAEVHSRRVESSWASRLALGLCGWAGEAVVVTASLRLDGSRAASTTVAASMRVHKSLALCVGYDDGAETVRGAVVVGSGELDAAAGAFQHAVLGASRGVTMRWSR